MGFSVLCLCQRRNLTNQWTWGRNSDFLMSHKCRFMRH
jgi:hypothetical protein